MDFDTVKRAGISQAQFADLVGVNRVTVNTWFKGHFNPQVRLRSRVRKAIDLIRSAVDDGDLPVRHDLGRVTLQQRLSTIEQALRTEG